MLRKTIWGVVAGCVMSLAWAVPGWTSSDSILERSLEDSLLKLPDLERGALILQLQEFSSKLEKKLRAIPEQELKAHFFEVQRKLHSLDPQKVTQQLLEKTPTPLQGRLAAWFHASDSEDFARKVEAGLTELKEQGLALSSLSKAELLRRIQDRRTELSRVLDSWDPLPGVAEAASVARMMLLAVLLFAFFAVILSTAIALPFGPLAVVILPLVLLTLLALGGGQVAIELLCLWVQGFGMYR
jgi:hypothetical protein